MLETYKIGGWDPNSVNTVTSNNPFDKHFPIEQDGFRCQFPQAGFWLGTLPLMNWDATCIFEFLL